MSTRSPAPAPYPSPAPAPYPSPAPAPAPAPYPQQAPAPVPAPVPLARAPFPSPAPAPVPIVLSSEEEEETETEFDSNHEDTNDFVQPQPTPTPVPVPISVAMPQPIDCQNDTEAVRGLPETQAHQEPQYQANAEALTNGDNHESKNLKAAADLIHTLDTAYAEANAATATTALDADEARTAQRTAAEILRRYTTGSHPRQGSDLTSTFDQNSPAAAYRSSSGKSPTTSAQAQSNNNNTSFFPPTSNENNNTKSQTPNPNLSIMHANNNTSNGNNNTPSSIYYPKASPSNRLVQSRSEDVLALSLELERARQALEAERMAHDETKNVLAEERSRSVHLQHKLHRLESTMETQRETLGRSGDALEEDLQRALLRMDAAEEDAQLALDFAKQSEEEREQLEQMLQEAVAEIQTLRHQSILPAIEEQQSSQDETPFKSILKSVTGDEAETEGKRSVHFSDPISFSNAPTSGESFVKNAQQQQQQFVEDESPLVAVLNGVSTPSRPARPLVSAGRKLLQQSTSKDASSSESNTYLFDYTPEKSAERRQRLRDTLKQMDSAVVIPTPTNAERSPHRKQLQFSTNVLELCKAASELLRASGQRLELDGQLWREKKDEESEETPLDSLTRRYCQSVEVSTIVENSPCVLSALTNFLQPINNTGSSSIPGKDITPKERNIRARIPVFLLRRKRRLRYLLAR